MERERPGTRIEVDALDDLRDVVAFLRAHGAPASLEQELTVAVRAHVAGMAARFGMTTFPERTAALVAGRRSGVWKRPPHDDGEDAVLDVAIEDESGDAPDVAPGVPMSPSTRRKIERLKSEGESPDAIASLLEVDVVAVRAVMGARIEHVPPARLRGPVRPHHPRRG